VLGGRGRNFVDLIGESFYTHFRSEYSRETLNGGNIWNIDRVFAIFLSNIIFWGRCKMFRRGGATGVLAAVGLVWMAAGGRADVFNMPPGLTSLEFVTVGDPGNTADTRFVTPGYGRVDYTYQIGKYDVTTGQYCEFLNAVAVTDTYGLYNPSMDTANDQFGCNIKRGGAPGSYSYSVATKWADRPVNFVSWGDAARFCNWLTNDQPSGLQALDTTEDGAYYLNGAASREELMTVTRKANAKYVIPTEDEWYKAAYYDPAKSGGPGYWTFATRSDTVPSNVFAYPDPGNHANYYNGANYTIGNPYYRNEVGAFTNSSSIYGTFDQSGNVWQWNETALTSTIRGDRGGAFNQLWDAMPAILRGGEPPNNEGRGMGFRIAGVPEPSNLVLLFLSFSGILIYRLYRNKRLNSFRKR
jgi:sulfatase modifying factor 1